MRELKPIMLLFIFVVGALCMLANTLYSSPPPFINKDQPARGEWNFDLKEQWSIQQFGDYLFARADTFQVDDNGIVYVLEKKFSKVFAFDSSGKFLFEAGGPGEGPKEFRLPLNLFLIGKYFIVYDMDVGVKFFTKTGEFKNSFKLEYNIFPREFLSETRFIMLRITDFKKKQEKQALEVYDLNTHKGTAINEISSEKDAKASSENARVRIRVPGTTSQVITAVSGNKIYFGNNGIYLIKKIDLDGTEELSFSLEGRKRKPVPMAYKVQQVKEFNPGTRLPEDIEKQLLKTIPDECTYFERIFIDESGLIYVFLTDVANHTYQGVDIFSPSGKYLYRSELKLPKGLNRVESFVLAGNYMYVLAEEEEGEQKLMKFNIKKPPIQHN